MAKIPLMLTEDSRPYLEATITGPHLNPNRISFLIDTGSPDTIISEGNAIVLKIPYKNLAKGTPVMGWGGSSYDTRVFSNATVHFKTDENQIFSIRLNDILISQLSTKMTEKERQISLSFPSVIGTDLFKNNGMLLHFDPAKSTAYIEKEESLVK